MAEGTGSSKEQASPTHGGLWRHANAPSRSVISIDFLANMFNPAAETSSLRSGHFARIQLVPGFSLNSSDFLHYSGMSLMPRADEPKKLCRMLGAGVRDSRPRRLQGGGAPIEAWNASNRGCARLRTCSAHRKCPLPCRRSPFAVSMFCRDAAVIASQVGS